MENEAIVPVRLGIVQGGGKRRQQEPRAAAVIVYLGFPAGQQTCDLCPRIERTDGGLPIRCGLGHNPKTGKDWVNPQAWRRDPKCIAAEVENG